MDIIIKGKAIGDAPELKPKPFQENRAVSTVRLSFVWKESKHSAFAEETSVAKATLIVEWFA